MSRKMISMLIGSLFVLISSVGVNAADLPKVVWQMPTTEASHDDWTVKAMDNFAAAVASRTEGRFKIMVSLGGELGIQRQELPKALSAGRIQAASLPAGHIAGMFPFMNVFGLPFLISSLDQGIKVGKAMEPITEREFGKVGIKPAAFFVMTPVGLWSKVKIADLTNLNNLKARAWDESTAEIVKTLGGLPIIMPVTEVYTALQRGVIQAVLTGAPAMLNVSAHELCKFGYLVNLAPACVYVGYNMKAYERLPSEYKTILDEEAAIMAQALYKAQPVEDNKSLDKMKEAGVTLVKPSSEEMAKVKEKVKPLWQKWVNKTGPVAAEAAEAAKGALGIE